MYMGMTIVNNMMKESKINMKTIIERAKEYSKGRWDEPTAYEAYIAGAKEQKAIDIEKACEWLGNYLMEIGYPDDWLRDSLNIKSGKERFRKAMEE